MSCRVFYTARVSAEIDAQIDYLRAQHVSEYVIAAWFAGLFDAIDALYEMPKRYPVDRPESQQQGFEVRKLIHRRYCIHYRVDDDGRTVEVLSFLHGARRRESGDA
jgi:plasmid stabilization system protein ParE